MIQREVVFDHPLSEYDTLMRKPFWRQTCESTHYDYETDKQGYVPSPDIVEVENPLPQLYK